MLYRDLLEVGSNGLLSLRTHAIRGAVRAREMGRGEAGPHRYRRVPAGTRTVDGGPDHCKLRQLV